MVCVGFVYLKPFGWVRGQHSTHYHSIRHNTEDDVSKHIHKSHSLLSLCSETSVAPRWAPLILRPQIKLVKHVLIFLIKHHFAFHYQFDI